MATVASVEALHCIKTKQPVMLSVQELIDRVTKNKGCEGGSPQPALDYILVNGLPTESSNPYMAGSSSISCCKKGRPAAARVTGFRTVSPTEYALEEAVAKQPVIVSLQSSSSTLRGYKGGIMDYEALPDTPPNHAVLIVGYGTDPDGVKYWRFKNSWGEVWGEGGFGRIRRHVGGERGVLGIKLEMVIK
jgi:C1A family cysteine protease